MEGHLNLPRRIQDCETITDSLTGISHTFKRFNWLKNEKPSFRGKSHYDYKSTIVTMKGTSI